MLAPRERGEKGSDGPGREGAELLARKTTRALLLNLSWTAMVTNRSLTGRCLSLTMVPVELVDEGRSR